MLLPHESTIGAGTGSAMVPSESSRGFGVGETISEGRENTLPLSPTEEEIGNSLPSEIINSENKMEDALIEQLWLPVVIFENTDQKESTR